MIGALIGDVIGRPYEMCNYKGTDFPLFSKHCRPTDDSVLTIAIADAFLNNKDIHTTLQDYYHWYPKAGYGMHFKLWAKDRLQVLLASTGNGAAMRVSPVAYLTDDMQKLKEYVQQSINPSHNSNDAFLGATAIAGSIMLARHGASKGDIHSFVQDSCYTVNFDYKKLVESYQIAYSCEGSVPQAIYCFLISNNYEDCMRKCVSIGGDTDTICCMAGGIAEAFYGGVPKKILEEGLTYFERDERLMTVIRDFNSKYLKYGYKI